MPTEAPPLPSISQAAAAPPQPTASASVRDLEAIANAAAEKFQWLCQSRAERSRRIEENTRTRENARLTLRNLRQQQEEEDKLFAEKREAGMHAHRVARAARQVEEEAEMSKFFLQVFKVF